MQGEGDQGLIRRSPLLHARRHGGATNSPGFIDAVGATTAVIGVGAGNDDGHPHPDVLADLSGIRVLRTGLHGTVSVTVEEREARRNREISGAGNT